MNYGKKKKIVKLFHPQRERKTRTFRLKVGQFKGDSKWLKQTSYLNTIDLCVGEIQTKIMFNFCPSLLRNMEVKDFSFKRTGGYFIVSQFVKDQRMTTSLKIRQG